MPPTSEIAANSPPTSEPGLGPSVETEPRRLLATGQFGEVALLAKRVLAGEGMALVTGQGWEASSEVVSRLVAAMQTHPRAAFAFGIWTNGPVEERGGGPSAMPVDAESLLSRPRELGPLVIRASEATRVGWPDFGPPDVVLDGALTWALAAALAVRGATGLYVPGALSRRLEAGPEAIDRLRPEGVAWLVATALSWSTGGKPRADLAESLWRRWTTELAAAGFDGLTPPRMAPQ